MKICFLASGGGGNLKFFFLSRKLKILDHFELFVIADRECGSIDFAKKNNVYSKIIDYKITYNDELLSELCKINPDIIITNWNKILDSYVVSKYSKKLINLHYSLLPAFKGLIGVAPIEEAYKLNSQYTGATCHFVNDDVDAGKIISQAVVKIDKDIKKVTDCVFRKGCFILLNSIIIVSKQNIISPSDNHKCDFSPYLQFDDDQFNEKFWGSLSML